MDALARWKARSRGEVTLPSGTTVTIELVAVSAEILAGTFPAPVIGLARAMESGTADLDHELTDEEIETAIRYRRIIVARMVRAIEGEEVTLTETDVADLPVADAEMLWAYHLRLVQLPPREEAPNPTKSGSKKSPSS